MNNEKALKLHSLYRGKLEIIPKCKISDFEDFAIWYTPGVAAPCKDIEKSPEKAFIYTNRWNLVAIVTDGSRLLGLGNIGAEAALPVMEGKALLFKYLGGVDAFPICLATQDAEEIIKICKFLQPSFGAISLEDIATPKCFYILERLQEEMNIPVWHDDQQGTATVVLAALINALKIVNKTKEKVKISMIGAGAANIGVAKMIIKWGFLPENIIMVDAKGILHKDREDLMTEENKEKWHLCQITNKEDRRGKIPEAMENTDICIALSKPGPGVIKASWVASMAKDAIVFACANPIPEIWPHEAKAAGAKIVATGRSDFPNQINNALSFPAILRGALDVAARKITDTMCIAAAEELAKYTEEKGLSEEYILPQLNEWEVFVREAVAVAMKSIEEGVAKFNLNKEELLNNSNALIQRAQNITKILMQEGIIN